MSPARLTPPPVIALARSALVALAITFVPQGIWSVLIGVNLNRTPHVPWAVVLAAVAIGLVARYSLARPQTDALENRSRPPRANAISRPVLMWSWVAGACALTALVGYWISFASLVRMPGSVLPDLSGYPWWTAWLAVATGAALSPLCEQIGLWGYWQVALEERFSVRTAVFVTALTFAVLPHPPAHAVLWPKWFFFFLTGLTFSTMAAVTGSILPGLSVHAVSLLTFFVLVWPYDAGRPLVSETGADGWLWIHIAQAAIFSFLACWAFRRLSQVSVRVAPEPRPEAPC